MVTPDVLSGKIQPVQRQLKPIQLLAEPFDIMTHNDDAALYSIQNRFAMFLRSLEGPARFATWHIPASLQPLIDWTLEEARMTAHIDPWRHAALMQYRTWYESFERDNNFQQALCGITVWAESDTNPLAIAMAAQSTVGLKVYPAKWLPLTRGQYLVERKPFWHLRPVGRPSGRPLICMLGTYKFLAVDWTFFRPMMSLYTMGIPLGMVVDIPRTWEAHDAIAKLEGVITAMNAHLSTSVGMDSTSYRQITDANEALADIHNGQALHDLHIKIAVPAETVAQLKERVTEIKKQLKSALSLRSEVGTDQLQTIRYFSSIPTRLIDSNPPTWPMTSKTAAMTLGFLGIRKLQPRHGIIRGTGGSYPYIYDDWETSQGKKATHEIWVGGTGNGKTFALNCFLSRSLAHFGIPFDLLEPMGHGHLLADVFNIEPFIVSARRSKLNPHDPITDQLGTQINHALMIYELFMQRQLSGSNQANQEGALLSHAIRLAYLERFTGDDYQQELRQMLPHQAPTISDVISILETLGNSQMTRYLASELAAEVRGLATGKNSRFGYFLDGTTTIDFSIASEHKPRIFMFHEMENNDILIQIAYTQVLASIMRTAMANDNPRIIAVDEVYRMMRHPALLEFLITAVKTLRTKRKKLISIDQQMRIFVSDPKARLIFENSPIRVIFSQKGGEDVFYNDPAFAHLNTHQRQIISELERFHFVMESDEGFFYLKSVASDDEFRRFGGS